MPPAKKRKTAKSAKTTEDTEAAQAPIEAPEAPEAPEIAPTDVDNAKRPETTEESTSVMEERPSSSSKPSTTITSASSSSSSNPADRLARFRALQARAKKSSSQNLAEASKESHRLASDPSALTALNRKRDTAQHKLLKAETEEAGENFERKRAWDWTAEESERWDKRLKKKAAARDNTAFKDDQSEGVKTYKRQVKNMFDSPNMAQYEKDKMAAIEKAAASGSLDIVETEDGELIAIDRDGSFYSTADSTSFIENKPDKAAVDRLVAEMKKAEENRMRKRRERMAANGDDGDVTYINEKNKQFNQKLNRFYNKYTADIRDSFERGTAI
ncbi:SYF2 splicing factor [Xylariales sp. AK1849]|nr:SYF2 splicing factor [Xylariales sp. AK1849]